MLLITNFLIETVTIEGAKADLKRFRNIEPAIYNEERLYEQPIPEFIDESALNAQENENNDAQIANMTNEFDSSVLQEIDRSQINGSGEGDQTNSALSFEGDIPNAIVVTMNGNMNFVPGQVTDMIPRMIQEQEEEVTESNDIANETENEVDVKPIVPLYDVANNNEILNQIEEHETFIVSDSDSEDFIEIKVGPKGFGKPLDTIFTPDGLFKRETPDEISGDMLFIEKVRTKSSILWNSHIKCSTFQLFYHSQKDGGRIYKVGDRRVLFPGIIFTKFSCSWFLSLRSSALNRWPVSRGITLIEAGIVSGFKLVLLAGRLDIAFYV